MMLEAYLREGSFAPDMVIKTTQMFILLVDLSQGVWGGGVLGVQENVPGTFLWAKLINESSLRCMDNEVTSP